MCTVTYLQLNNREFILTSNRDEDILREVAIPFQEYTLSNKSIYFPKDPKANGTWIAYDVNGYTLCLLNGATHKHIAKTNYKKSRGLVLLDFFEYNDPELFSKDYNFEGIEPFTLILVYACSITNTILLYELKWDETSAILTKLDSSIPHIWSSATLYTPQIIEARKRWFYDWLEKQSAFSSEEILFFHHFAGSGSSENDLMINRGNKKTVSISSIQKNSGLTEITYEDLVIKKLYKNKIISC